MFKIFNPAAFLTSYVGEWVFDKIRDSVLPVPGSVVYCDFHVGLSEHSGIYIGDNKIVHLNGKGEVRAVSPMVFLKSTTAMNIQVSCRGARAVGSERVAERARSMLGSTRDYNFILDNCHQFSTGCLTGDFENPSNFLWMLKHAAKEHLGADTWRLWDR
jgi:hypothetical protein